MLPFLDHITAQLAVTPTMLSAWIPGLPEDLWDQNEGEDTWSIRQIIFHLIHGEDEDWIPRAKIILSDREDKTFEPFERMVVSDKVQQYAIGELLHHFHRLRDENILTLGELGITEPDLEKTGIHPEFGEVTLRQLLATWVAHDQTHIYQIARIISYQLKDEVGPWMDYLRILHQNYPESK